MKEDYLEVPESLNRIKKRVSGRSIYMGDREAFFKYLSTQIGSQKKSLEKKLLPVDQMKRLNQCLGWHKAVM